MAQDALNSILAFAGPLDIDDVDEQVAPLDATSWTSVTNGLNTLHISPKEIRHLYQKCTDVVRVLRKWLQESETGRTTDQKPVVVLVDHLCGFLAQVQADTQKPGQERAAVPFLPNALAGLYDTGIDDVVGGTESTGVSISLHGPSPATLGSPRRSWLPKIEDAVPMFQAALELHAASTTTGMRRSTLLLTSCCVKLLQSGVLGPSGQGASGTGGAATQSKKLLAAWTKTGSKPSEAASSQCVLFSLLRARDLALAEVAARLQAPVEVTELAGTAQQGGPTDNLERTQLLQAVKCTESLVDFVMFKGAADSSMGSTVSGSAPMSEAFTGACREALWMGQVSVLQYKEQAAFARDGQARFLGQAAESQHAEGEDDGAAVQGQGGKTSKLDTSAKGGQGVDPRTPLYRLPVVTAERSVFDMLNAVIASATVAPTTPPKDANESSDSSSLNVKVASDLHMAGSALRSIPYVFATFIRQRRAAGEPMEVKANGPAPAFVSATGQGGAAGSGNAGGKRGREASGPSASGSAPAEAMAAVSYLRSAPEFTVFTQCLCAALGYAPTPDTARFGSAFVDVQLPGAKDALCADRAATVAALLTVAAQCGVYDAHADIEPHVQTAVLCFLSSWLHSLLQATLHDFVESIKSGAAGEQTWGVQWGLAERFRGLFAVVTALTELCPALGHGLHADSSSSAKAAAGQGEAEHPLATLLSTVSRAHWPLPVYNGNVAFMGTLLVQGPLRMDVLPPLPLITEGEEAQEDHGMDDEDDGESEEGQSEDDDSPVSDDDDDDDDDDDEGHVARARPGRTGAPKARGTGKKVSLSKADLAALQAAEMDIDDEDEEDDDSLEDGKGEGGEDNGEDEEGDDEGDRYKESVESLPSPYGVLFAVTSTRSMAMGAPENQSPAQDFLWPVKPYALTPYFRPNNEAIVHHPNLTGALLSHHIEVYSRIRQLPDLLDVLGRQLLCMPGADAGCSLSHHSPSGYNAEDPFAAQVYACKEELDWEARLRDVEALVSTAVARMSAASSSKGPHGESASSKAGKGTAKGKAAPGKEVTASAVPAADLQTIIDEGLAGLHAKTSAAAGAAATESLLYYQQSLALQTGIGTGSTLEAFAAALRALPPGQVWAVGESLSRTAMQLAHSVYESVELNTSAFAPVEESMPLIKSVLMDRLTRLMTAGVKASDLLLYIQPAYDAAAREVITRVLSGLTLRLHAVGLLVCEYLRHLHVTPGVASAGRALHMAVKLSYNVTLPCWQAYELLERQGMAQPSEEHSYFRAFHALQCTLLAVSGEVHAACTDVALAAVSCSPIRQQVETLYPQVPSPAVHSKENIAPHSPLLAMDALWPMGVLLPTARKYGLVPVPRDRVSDLIAEEGSEDIDSESESEDSDQAMLREAEALKGKWASLDPAMRGLVERLGFEPALNLKLALVREAYPSFFILRLVRFVLPPRKPRRILGETVTFPGSAWSPLHAAREVFLRLCSSRSHALHVHLTKLAHSQGLASGVRGLSPNALGLQSIQGLLGCILRHSGAQAGNVLELASLYLAEPVLRSFFDALLEPRAFAVGMSSASAGCEPDEWRLQLLRDARLYQIACLARQIGPALFERVRESTARILMEFVVSISPKVRSAMAKRAKGGKKQRTKSGDDASIHGDEDEDAEDERVVTLAGAVMLTGRTGGHETASERTRRIQQMATMGDVPMTEQMATDQAEHEDTATFYVLPTGRAGVESALRQLTGMMHLVGYLPDPAFQFEPARVSARVEHVSAATTSTAHTGSSSAHKGSHGDEDEDSTAGGNSSTINADGTHSLQLRKKESGAKEGGGAAPSPTASTASASATSGTVLYLTAEDCIRKIIVATEVVAAMTVSNPKGSGSDIEECRLAALRACQRALYSLLRRPGCLPALAAANKDLLLQAIHLIATTRDAASTSLASASYVALCSEYLLAHILSDGSMSAGSTTSTPSSSSSGHGPEPGSGGKKGKVKGKAKDAVVSVMPSLLQSCESGLAHLLTALQPIDSSLKRAAPAHRRMDVICIAAYLAALDTRPEAGMAFTQAREAAVHACLSLVTAQDLDHHSRRQVSGDPGLCSPALAFQSAASLLHRQTVPTKLASAALSAACQALKECAVVQWLPGVEDMSDLGRGAITALTQGLVDLRKAAATDASNSDDHYGDVCDLLFSGLRDGSTSDSALCTIAAMCVIAEQCKEAWPTAKKDIEALLLHMPARHLQHVMARLDTKPSSLVLSLCRYILDAASSAHDVRHFNEAEAAAHATFSDKEAEGTASLFTQNTTVEGCIVVGDEGARDALLTFLRSVLPYAVSVLSKPATTGQFEDTAKAMAFMHAAASHSRLLPLRPAEVNLLLEGLSSCIQGALLSVSLPAPRYAADAEQQARDSGHTLPCDTVDIDIARSYGGHPNIGLSWLTPADPIIVASGSAVARHVERQEHTVHEASRGKVQPDTHRAFDGEGFYMACMTLHALVRYRKTEALNALHTVTGSLQALCTLALTPVLGPGRDQDGYFLPVHLAGLTRAMEQLPRLLKVARYNAVHLLTRYCTLASKRVHARGAQRAKLSAAEAMAGMPVPAAVRQLLQPGVFALLDVCRPAELQAVHTALGALSGTSAHAARAMFKALHKDYEREHKYTGKA